MLHLGMYTESLGNLKVCKIHVCMYIMGKIVAMGVLTPRRSEMRDSGEEWS